jgi:hypothetical protein
MTPHTARHDHDEHEGDVRPHLQRRTDEEPQHPLLDLQQQAGNAAVARLMAVQRHTLDPEEEHG